MKPKTIQITTAAVCLCVLVGGLYLIRRSFNTPAEIPKTATIPLREQPSPEALDLGSESSNADGYQAEMRTAVPAEAQDGTQDGAVEKGGEGSGGKWSDEECKRFTAHLRRLQAKANGNKGIGNPESREADEKLCADKDVSPAFMRCALTKDSLATLIECAGLGAELPLLSDEEAEAMSAELRAILE
ncbi:MAG: hypothetical protein GY811_15500 [Myxococcales bacterium]|nr:hypothetical protein [Myxococcales bacterium]